MNVIKFVIPNNVSSITNITNYLSRDIQTNITNNIKINFLKYVKEYIKANFYSLVNSQLIQDDQLSNCDINLILGKNIYK